MTCCFITSDRIILFLIIGFEHLTVSDTVVVYLSLIISKWTLNIIKAIVLSITQGKGKGQKSSPDTLSFNISTGEKTLK